MYSTAADIEREVGRVVLYPYTVDWFYETIYFDENTVYKLHLACNTLQITGEYTVKFM